MTKLEKQSFLPIIPNGKPRPYRKRVQAILPLLPAALRWTGDPENPINEPGPLPIAREFSLDENHNLSDGTLRTVTITGHKAIKPFLRVADAPAWSGTFTDAEWPAT